MMGPGGLRGKRHRGNCKRRNEDDIRRDLQKEHFWGVWGGVGYMGAQGFYGNRCHPTWTFGICGEDGDAETHLEEKGKKQY